MTTNNRAFHLVFTLVATVLALVVLSAPSAYADQSYTDTYTSVSGQYGAKVGSTYYRYSNYSGSIPLELITGSGSTAKYLYGVGTTVPINVRQQAYSYWYQGRFTLSQSSTNFNSQGNAFRTTAPVEATVRFADNTTQVTTDCGYGVPTSLSIIVQCEFESTKVPTQMFITYGTVGQFSDNTSDAIGYYSSAFNNGSIRITNVEVEVREYSSEESATAGAINNIGDTMDDIHQDEKDTIDDAIDDAHNAANGLNLSFSVINPIINWLALFRDDACVSIPTISSWLNTNETLVCSPWRNTTVRAGLTPIFTLLGTMLVTAFVFRWLSSNNSEGTVEGV